MDGRPASVPVVGISGVSRKALALAVVVLGNADGVGSARELRANWDALENSESVRNALGHLRAVQVGGAPWNRRFLAGGRDGVPDVIGFAMANGVVLVVQLARLV